MKVTTNFFYETFVANLNKQLDAMYKDQLQLATGKRVLSPGDDPVAISRITKYKSEIAALDEYQRVIDTAKNYNSAIETAIEDLKNMVIQAKQYAVQGSTDTLSATGRLALADDVNTLIQRSIDTVNTKIGGRYIFAGYKGDTPPVNASTGVYESDSNLQYLDINSFLDVPVNLPASKFFTYVGASTQVFTPYNQTDTGSIHDVDPLSALLMSRPSGGAIIDPTTPFTTNGGTLTIKFADNNPVEVTIGAPASLNDVRDAINSQAGDYVKAWVVNTGTSTVPDYRLVINSMPAGKSDQIRISINTTDAAGTGLNLLSYSPETGSATMTVENNINGYNYITDATDPNYYSFNNNYLNESNYLRAVYFLKVALENNDQGRIQKAVDYMDKISDNLYKQQSIIGARLSKIESITDYNLDIKTNTQQSLSNDQDADAVQVISDLTQRMSVLQALRVTFTDFFRSNLFDFLS
ncbi:MAG TPA: flagellar hook-associated protein FlgL [Thermodesulfovibrio thiophilus]|nr:flagellar hook-associated protein FlgL [Thermodesulfovibrio thiophilus]